MPHGGRLTEPERADHHGAPEVLGVGNAHASADLGTEVVGVVLEYEP